MISQISSKKIEEIELHLIFIGWVRRKLLGIDVKVLVDLLCEVRNLRIQNHALEEERARLRREINRLIDSELNRQNMYWQSRAQDSECVLHLLRNWLVGKTWLCTRMPKRTWVAFMNWCNTYDATPPQENVTLDDPLHP